VHINEKVSLPNIPLEYLIEPAFQSKKGDAPLGKNTENQG
jgi:hypothetical protein